MSGTSTLESRIAAIEDREAIADLVHAYAEAIRNGREKDCLDLMTEDAAIELHHADPQAPGASELISRYSGKGEIETSFESTAGSSARVWAMIHNLRIELHGDEAASTCVMMSAIWPHGKQYVGEYRDRFRRQRDGWKFSARRYTVFGDTTGRYSRDAHADYVAAKTDIGD